MKRTATRPSPQDVPPEETARVAATGVAHLDLDRAAAYAGLGTLRSSKAASFDREQRLVARKYGANHPRVAEVAERRAANAVFARDLAVAHALAATPAPPIDAEGYLFHGFVRDCDRKPLPQLTVALYDSQGKWIAGLGYGCTDETGYFLLRSAPGANPDWAGTTATIRVYNAEQKLVHREAEPLKPAAGAADYREIVICEDGVCVPPPDVPDEPPPEPMTVPDVVGKTERAASAELERAGFKVSARQQESGADNVGRVIEQKPGGGSKAAPGSVVAIVVGIPQSKIAVPNVVGVTLRDAQAILKKAEFAVGKIEPAGAPLESKVVKQSPAAGELAERGSAVDLGVEPPVELVEVPDVVERTLAEAKEKIRGSNLVVGTIKPADASDHSRVVEQSPQAGGKVAPRTAIDLVVRETQSQIAVPDLTGLTLAQTKEALAKVKLEIGRVKPADATAEFVVAAQSPAAGTSVNEGAAVDLELRAITRRGKAKRKPPRE
jgi:beta-lactam-binding protein with PASTA domain